MKLYLRVLVQKTIYMLAQPKACEAWITTHAEAASNLFLFVLASGLLDFRKNSLNFPSIPLSPIGELDASPRSLRQRKAESLFQSDDAVAYGTASQIEFFRSARNAAQTGYGIQSTEGCHRRKMHGGSASKSIDSPEW